MVREKYCASNLCNRNPFISLIFAANCSAFAQSGWGASSANLTVAEYLELSFKMAMERHETGALNDYSMVSFYPTDSPETALIVIIQTWHDERINQTDLRREIRTVGNAVYNHFKALVLHQTIAKRWRSERFENNFIVKHVRYTDLRESLAVTVGNATFFDPEEIKHAETLVRSRGGVWGW